MIPCKECLIFALCKHREPLECSLLVGWIENYSDSPDDVLRRRDKIKKLLDMHSKDSLEVTFKDHTHFLFKDGVVI
jgi:hypothetical protein